jgi:flagellar biosynthesis anti-sigma factor FlgM
MASGIDRLGGGADVGPGAAGNGSTVPIQRPGSPATTPAPPAPADSVTITDSARLLASLTSAVAGSSGIDHARVESLRRAIESGQYTVSAEGIAAGLLAMERNLGPARR